MDIRTIGMGTTGLGMAAMLAIALGLVATTVRAESPRIVVIVGRPEDPRVAQQHAALAPHAAALRERAVVLQDVTPDAARRDRPGLGVPPGISFQVVLIGRDGGVKLRRDQPVAAAEITALIDTMPMRRNEMRR